MSLLCDLATFKHALKECVFLLTEKNLSPRGVNKDILLDEDLRKLKNFLSWLVVKIDEGVNSYEGLIKELQKPATPSVYKLQMGFLGKILDAVQVVKPGTLRNRSVIKAIKEALNRTGHKSVWKEADSSEREKYSKELVRATATFHLLEVIFSKTKITSKKNPIATLRRSMGDRLPEEYFAELLAGWFIEDVIKSGLESKGFATELMGVDRERKVFFVRPSSMGDYDLKVEMGTENYLLEVQRVGKLAKVMRDKKIRTNKKTEVNVKGFFYTTLKSHKYEGGDRNDKILILWIGKEPTQIAKAYSKWFNHLIFIRNIRYQKEMIFLNDTIYFKENLLVDRALSWDKFKGTDGKELRKIFQKFTMGP